MEIIGELISEILMIILALGLFVFFVGIKVSCPECGARFYFKKDRKKCPACQASLEVDSTDQKTAEESATEEELECYLCYGCGIELFCQVDYCPSCGCWLGFIDEDADDSKNPVEEKNK